MNYLSINNKTTVSFAAVGLLFSINCSLKAEDHYQRPTVEEALHYFQSLPPIGRQVDGKQQWIQQWKDKSIHDLQTMKEIMLGGHIKGGAHLKIEPEDWKYFTALEQVKVARLIELEGADDTAFHHLGHLSQSVNFLFIELTTVTDDGVKPLQNLKNLKFLGIVWSENIGDGALKHMAKMPGLETILVNGCKKVTGAGVRHLVGHKNLKTLKVVKTSVDDNALSYFKQLDIEELDLGLNQITYEGLSNLLNDPHNLPHLKTLTLKHIPLTDQQIDLLKSSRPKLTIVR